MPQRIIYTRPVVRGAGLALAAGLLTAAGALRVSSEPKSTAVAAPPSSPPTTAPAAPPPPPAPPVGTGMWIWEPGAAEGGDVAAIVARARAAGLTHLYARTGSSWQGFHGAGFLDQLLPAAHAAGLRVYGWDFPNFRDVGTDVARAVAAIAYTTPDGHRIDGFVPDIETPAEGTVLTVENVVAYGTGLRAAVGVGYPLIACVPNPTPSRLVSFPYAETVAPFDAIAPMVYWVNREPDADVASAIAALSAFGKPVHPVGQAFDATGIGGRPGPTTDEIARFLVAAEAHGAAAMSFWSWQHAGPDVWAAIATTP